MFKIDTRRFVFCCLFTALVVVGGFISFPLGVVPVAFGDFFVMLSASFQNPLCAFLSVIFYELLGIIGLPVFSGGKSGIAVFMGPTAGYLVGYIFLSLILSFMLYRKSGKKVRLWFYIFSLFVSNLVLYFFGVLGLALNLSMPIDKAIYSGVLIFLPGTILKSAVCSVLYRLIDIWRY